MALTLRLGQGFDANQRYLPGTDASQLPAPASNTLSSEPLVFTKTDPQAGDSYDVPGPFGVGTAQVGALTGGLSFKQVDDWNWLKNIQLTDDGSKNLYIDGFVHVDVLLGTSFDNCSRPVGSQVTVHNAKRGNILTGDGNDAVTIDMAADDTQFAAVHEFRVATKGGDDVVQLRTGKFTNNTSGSGAVSDTGQISSERMITDGSKTKTFVDAGAGNDKVIAAAGTVSADQVFGRAGNDTISTAGGNDIIEGGTDCGLYAVFTWKIGKSSGTTKVFAAGDTLEGGGGADTFIYHKGDGVDLIKDFNKVEGDKLVLDKSLEANTVVEKVGSDTYVSFKGNGIGFKCDPISGYVTDSAIKLMGVTNFDKTDIQFA